MTSITISVASGMLTLKRFFAVVKVLIICFFSEKINLFLKGKTQPNFSHPPYNQNLTFQGRGAIPQ
jgi:uncharacterized membrane protein YfhO